MKKILLPILVLLTIIACDDQKQSGKLDVFSIQKREGGLGFFVMTEHGGYNFWSEDIKVSLDESVETPKGIFWINNSNEINAYRSCILIFSNKEQAQDWLKSSSKITVNGNTNSDISVSHSESHSKSGCFISTVWN